MFELDSIEVILQSTVVTILYLSKFIHQFMMFNTANSILHEIVLETNVICLPVDCLFFLNVFINTINQYTPLIDNSLECSLCPCFNSNTYSSEITVNHTSVTIILIYFSNENKDKVVMLMDESLLLSF